MTKLSFAQRTPKTSDSKAFELSSEITKTTVIQNEVFANKLTAEERKESKT